MADPAGLLTAAKIAQQSPSPTPIARRSPPRSGPTAHDKVTGLQRPPGPPEPDLETLERPR
jgi:hypothetical protein